MKHINRDLNDQAAFRTAEARKSESEAKIAVEKGRAVTPINAAAQVLRNVFAHVEAQHIRVVELFFTVDTDGSGELDVFEFEDALMRMGMDLTTDQCAAAFKELDTDDSGDIEIEEFMSRLRAEKKWRDRKAGAKSTRAQQRDEVMQAALMAQTQNERTQILDEAAKKEWNRAAMRQTLHTWGDNLTDWDNMDDDEMRMRKAEMATAKAEMLADKEEQEAREAEAMYNKEELEAIAAEKEFEREKAEAEEAIALADKEEAEAVEAIVAADKEEREAKLAEEDALMEFEEAEIARMNFESVCRSQLAAVWSACLRGSVFRCASLSKSEKESWKG